MPTVNERILLHLLRYWKLKENLPEEITQKGISASAGIRRSHVPRAVKKLESDGLLVEKREHLSGRGRRVKMYFLTDKGIRLALRLRKELEGTLVTVKSESMEATMSLKEVEEVYDLDLPRILGLLGKGGTLDVRGFLPQLEGEEFIDRRIEIKQLNEWIAKPTGVFVIYGNRGFGKTALARYFVDHLEGWKVFWKDIEEDDETTDILRPLAWFAFRKGGTGPRMRTDFKDVGASLEAMMNRLKGSNSLLVLDSYFKVGEDIVELLSSLCELINGVKGLKLLVVAQEETPAYCRFYDRGKVDEGLVEEMHLRGLSEESTKKMLDTPNISPDALRRIYLLTKGCPLYLKLVREGDQDGLREKSRFTTPEIQLLMFSKSVIEE